MKKVLLSDVKVYDGRSDFHLRRVHVLVDGGIIAYVGSVRPSADCVIEGTDLGVSAGWIDLQADFCEPGFENKETLESGLLSAQAGGYVGVGVWPTTRPRIETKADVLYLRHQARRENGFVEVFPFSALTVKGQGRRLTDMIDLHHAGAVAFTDGSSSIDDARVFVQALQYASTFDGLVVHRSEETSMVRHAPLHEGQVSLAMGLPGSPAVAESVRLYRDLSLLAYTQGRLHVSGISTAEGVQLVAEAKRKGLRVTCDVSVAHLAWSEERVRHFDTMYKMSPPLRGERDRQALLEGVKSRVIDAIVSAHTPCDREEKELPFALAAPGIVCLQTTFALLNQAVDAPLDSLLPLLCEGPRCVLRMPQPCLSVGQKAVLTVFDAKQVWTLDDVTHCGRARNTPLYGQKLQGRPVLLVRGKEMVFCDERRRVGKEA